MSLQTKLHKAGDPNEPLPVGGFILTHGFSWASKIIRLGERIRGKGYNWNHAAYIYSPNIIIEALGKGVQPSDINKYRDTEYLVVWDTALSTEDLREMQIFVENVLRERTKYDYFEILCLGITLLLRLGKRHLLFGFSGTMICSGLVSETLTRAGAIFPIPPGYMTPADLDNWIEGRNSYSDIVR